MLNCIEDGKEIHKHKIWKKGLVLIVILLFIGMSVVPSIANKMLVVKPSIMPINGDTLYVGGSGPGNYSRIQDAIDNASDGDTVFVYDDSSPYNKNLIVDKSIQLIGEDKNTTVIDGYKDKHTVYISSDADGVTIKGFSFRNSDIDLDDVAIYICSSYNIINDNDIINLWGIYIGEGFTGNVISNNTLDVWQHGIYVEYSDGNIVSGNTIQNGIYSAIVLIGSSDNFLFKNIIIDQYYGVLLVESCNNNIISGNTILNIKWEGLVIDVSGKNIVFKNEIENTDSGIIVHKSDNNEIYRNSVTKTRIGIGVYYSHMNEIYENNFFDNEKDGSWQITIMENIQVSLRNKWDGNYWGRPLIYPKLVFGKIIFGATGPIPLTISWPRIDWHPAKEPYEIGV